MVLYRNSVRQGSCTQDFTDKSERQKKNKKKLFKKTKKQQQPNNQNQVTTEITSHLYIPMFFIGNVFWKLFFLQTSKCFRMRLNHLKSFFREEQLV